MTRVRLKKGKKVQGLHPGRLLLRWGNEKPEREIETE